jgi:hypothetical protein
MEDERRRPKEYYQVNLDTGRIFWIAFLIGIVVIGIFIFGYYVGGEKLKNGISALGKSELFDRASDASQAAERAGRELPFLDIFEKNLEAETRFLDVDSAEEPTKGPGSNSFEIEKDFQVPENDIYYPPFDERKIAVSDAETVEAKRRTYREIGNYYIQVASFSKKENAEKFSESLRKKMYKVEIEEAVVNEKLFYRVRVGPFETKSIARNTMIAMRNRYNIKDPFVLKKNS